MLSGLNVHNRVSRINPASIVTTGWCVDPNVASHSPTAHPDSLQFRPSTPNPPFLWDGCSLGQYPTQPEAARCLINDREIETISEKAMYQNER